MEAYKINGIIDSEGNLIIDEPINLEPGKVEVIILQQVANNAQRRTYQPEITPKIQKTRAFREWFAKIQPMSSDFDVEAAKWEALQEKYKL